LNWIVVFIALALLLPIVGALYQFFGLRRDRRFPPPGRLLDIGGTRVHFDSMGEGEPLVIFEAGIAATSLSWRRVQPEVARFTRTIAYDRAGLGWSDASNQPRGLARVTQDLRDLIRHVAPEGPVILVAHSYGGLVVREYAARYPSEIAGLVLIDPVATSEWSNPAPAHLRNLRRGIRLARRGGLLARLGVVRFALTLVSAGARRMPRLIARASSGAAAGFTDRMAGEIRKLPREIWPMVQAHWCDPKCFETMARYLQALPASSASVAAHSSLGDLPQVVFSAGNGSRAQRAEHERLARLSSQGRLETLPASGHWIQLDHPELVVDAIRELALASRTRSA
jgi:pimeloyl-ACP methyl ester carboxylesterase